MIKILLTTHGALCRGMLETLKIFTSDLNNVTAIPFYIEEEGYDAEKILHDYISKITDEDVVLVFTDILWGSVNQKMNIELGNRENVHIITGLNLPLVLELVTLNEKELTKEIISSKVLNCQQSMIYMKDYEVAFQDGDE